MLWGAGGWREQPGGAVTPHRSPIPGYLGLYVFYVFTVVLCTWIHRRQRREGLAPAGPWQPGKGPPGCADGTPSVLGSPSTAPLLFPPEMPTDAEEQESSGTNSGDYGMSLPVGSGPALLCPWGWSGVPGTPRVLHA